MFLNYQLGTNFHFPMKCNPSIHYWGRTFLNIFSCLLACLLLMKCNFNPLSIIFNQRLAVASQKPAPTVHSIFLTSCGSCTVISQYAVYWGCGWPLVPTQKAKTSLPFQPALTCYNIRGWFWGDQGCFRGTPLSSKPQHIPKLLCTRFELTQQ